jgi:2-dehydropantoate 2-reductase
MKVAVVGAGGTGAYFGGLLARAGNDVTFIARGEHLRAINRDGLTVKSPHVGDFTLTTCATDRTFEVGPVDLVLVCVKSYDNDSTIPQLPPLVGPETMLLSVQNGIDNERRIAEVVGADAVMGSIALVISAIEAPGIVRHMAGGHITFGEMCGGTSPRAERLLGVFNEAGISAELHTDINVKLWDKFVGICAFSGVTSLTRLTIGPVMACPETRELYRSTLAEVTALGLASSVALPDDTVDSWQDSMIAMGTNQPEASSSMHHDLKVGRRLEVNLLNGMASRMGKELGVPTPCNDVIHAALMPYANGAPEIPTNT